MRLFSALMMVQTETDFALQLRDFSERWRRTLYGATRVASLRTRTKSAEEKKKENGFLSIIEPQATTSLQNPTRTRHE